MKQKIKQLTAFTLAEVLITLGIIGIVAAMTMPTIIANYKKKVTVEKLKQTYSMFNQVLAKSQADNGDLKNWDYSLSDEDFTQLYILPYLTSTSISRYTIHTLYTGKGGEYLYWSNLAQHYLSKNGVAWSLRTLNDVHYLMIDLNGKQAPNILGVDAFTFEISPTRNRLEPFCANKTREQILNTDVHACKRDNQWFYYRGGCCAALIMKDGWKISDDYPW